MSILAVSLFALGAANPSSAQTACDAARVTASDAEPFESFGYAVGVWGDTALIGAQWNLDNGPQSGSAYVFGFDRWLRTWTETQLLLGSDGDSSDHFGVAVAIERETALIGAFAHLHSDNGGSGSAYVFRLNGSSWIEHQELLASDDAIGDKFGRSVALSGDVAVIGAPSDDPHGSAYLFRFDGSRWIEEQKLLASDSAGAFGNGFGLSVAISGTIAVIGAPGHVHDGLTLGSAYVFRFNGSTWVEEQELLPSADAGSAAFGSAVSIRGEVILIGARSEGYGSAYVFRYDREAPPGSQWVLEQKLLASDPNGIEQFGKSVAVDGDTAVIGAWASNAGGPGSGAAYVFRFNPRTSTWAQQQQLLPDPNPWTNFFGRSVAIDGDTVVIGAHGEDHQAGAAYVLDLSACLCPADLNGDGSVGILDLLTLLAAWGTDPGGPPDFDGDGNVGILDLLGLLANWGLCP
ncbi:MAG: hypothetical protein IH983_02500 [Planctomycetes bacterium]|nr:hypothetical protein [Planctomycetota bacterium]